MTARETFQFDQKYTLRPAGKQLSDYELAEDWTAADPDHCGKVDPRFWLEQGDGNDAYLFSDDAGPLFFFKMILAGTTVEIHIQFPPNHSSAHQRQRIARGLLQGIAWLERVLAHCHIREMYFDSINSSLIGFSIKRLGFQFIGGKLRKLVAA